MKVSDSFKAATQNITKQINPIDIKELKHLIQNSQVYKEGYFWHIGNDYQFDYEGGELFKKQEKGKPSYLYTVQQNDLDDLVRYCEMRQSVLQYKIENVHSDTEIENAIEQLKQLIQTSQVYKEGYFWHIGNDYQFDYEGGELFKKHGKEKPKYLYAIPEYKLADIIQNCEQKQNMNSHNQKQVMIDR